MRLALLGLFTAACHRPAPQAPIVHNAAPVAPSVTRSSPYKPVNIAFMARGYFYASSAIDVGLGGHATSENAPHPNSELGDSARTGLYIQALPDSVEAFENGFDGMRVVVVNASLVPAVFQASDSRLAIMQEAQDANGDWKPIEYLPGSFCGNSYHDLTLQPGQHWAFVAPRYSGAFKTKLRLRLVVGDRLHEETVYSNEFAGSVNLTQFTEKQGHGRRNIMDPAID